jgi:hypothetical protein
MILSEDDKKEILAKYTGETSNEVLTHLKRNFPTYDFQFKWTEKPFRQILVDDKLITLENNKKYLVGKISSILEDQFPHIEKSILRRTVKKYLDGVK